MLQKKSTKKSDNKNILNLEVYKKKNGAFTYFKFRPLKPPANIYFFSTKKKYTFLLRTL